MGDNLSRRRGLAKLADTRAGGLTLVCLPAVLMIIDGILAPLRWEACRDEGKERVDAA